MTLTSILITIVVGFVVGLLARALKPGNDGMGFILTTVVGIAGAFLASFIGQSTGFYTQGEAAGWIASILGAMVLLLVVGLLRGRR